MLKYRASYTEAGLCRRPYYIGLGARLCGRPITKICVDMEGDIGRRPYEVYEGSPTEQEARC